jgi:hypothetical protein
MQKVLCVATAAALFAASPFARAVVLNPHGTGQVLIYPYYTVNAGFGTLLSIVNTTSDGKALKVHVREGYNGRDVLIFNLYLSPYDTWVGQIFDNSADGSGAAALATNDSSCTVPVFAKTFGPAPGQGPGVAAFSTAGFTGSIWDGGPTDPTRTREGYVEIIDMGTVTNDVHATLDAITHGSNGVPSKCAQLSDAWNSGGYWTGNPSTDLDVPSGGLYGAESIINIGVGLLYTVNAEAIDGFSNAVQHTAPGNAIPDLGSASKDANGVVSAFVPLAQGMVRADFTQAEDAISALFMADTLYNEYVVDANVGAMTDWIVTFPTKRFYTDFAVLGRGSPARKPFDVLFTSYLDGSSAVAFGPNWFDREESLQSLFDGICPGVCPSAWDFFLPYVANAIPLRGSVSALGSHLLVNGSFGDFAFDAGHMTVLLTTDWQGTPDPNHVLGSTNGIVFQGLPATGFAATNYVNGNVMPGVLADYSGTYPHRATASCASTAPVAACTAGGTP